MIIEIVTARVHYGFPGLGSVMPFIKDARSARARREHAPKRSPQLPNVPTLLEFLPDFEKDADTESSRLRARSKAIVDQHQQGCRARCLHCWT